MPGHDKSLEERIVYPHFSPKNADGSVTVKISTPKIHDQSYTITLKIPKSLYNGAKSGQHYTSVPQGVSEKIWRHKSLQSFIFHDNHTSIYDALLKSFREIRKELRLDTDEYLEFLSSYVQNLEYDTAKSKDSKRNPRFPIETLVDMKGICSDKSLLLAAMLQHEGYTVCLMSFRDENHMTVGIPAPHGYDYRNTGYAIIEATCPSFVGSKNQGEGGSLKLRSIPDIIPIGKGKLQYTAFKEAAWIIETEEKLRDLTSGKMSAAIDKEKKEIEQIQKNLRQFSHEIEKERQNNSIWDKKTTEKFNQKVDEYNRQNEQLRKKIAASNAYIEKYNSYIELIRFISRHTSERKKVVREIKRILG